MTPTQGRTASQLEWSDVDLYSVPSSNGDLVTKSVKRYENDRGVGAWYLSAMPVSVFQWLGANLGESL